MLSSYAIERNLRATAYPGDELTAVRGLLHSRRMRKKKNEKRLSVKVETLRQLTTIPDAMLGQVAGGTWIPKQTARCP